MKKLEELERLLKDLGEARPPIDNEAFTLAEERLAKILRNDAEAMVAVCKAAGEMQYWLHSQICADTLGGKCVEVCRNLNAALSRLGGGEG